VSPPAGYRLGDWERFAASETEKCDQHLSSMPATPWGDASTEDLAEYHGVLSTLKAAEFLASHFPQEQIQGAGKRIADALSNALVLAQKGVRDTDTLQASLLRSLGPEAASEIRHRFDRDVSGLLDTIRSVQLDNPQAVATLPYKARLLLLAEHLQKLKSLQQGGLHHQAAEVEFVELAERAHQVRDLLAGTHTRLEAGLDEVFAGQVRLADGKLVAVEHHRRRYQNL